MNRCALIISHDFPPAGGPGVQRVLNFVKYLPQAGWCPVVLTAKAEAYEVRDETLMASVAAGTPVYRVADPHVNRLRPAFSRFGVGSLLSAINLALLLPDAHLMWAVNARAAARQILLRHRPAVVLSSSPPASAHLLAMWIHRRFRIPWVADFRDPWSDNRQIPYYPGYRALNRRMERHVLGRCDHVTTVSPMWADTFRRSVAGAGDVTLIENGYDEARVEALPPPRTARFTMTHAGTFNRHGRPDAFVSAVSELIRSGGIPARELRVALAGKNAARYVPDRSPFEHLGYLSHAALAELRRESDLLLLVLDDAPASRGVYSGKLFEHLACNRPTLCITHPDNVAARLIMRARAGVVVPPSPAEIAGAIARYHRVWKQGAFEHDPDWEIIRRFTGSRLTRRLADTFERVVQGPELAHRRRGT